MLLSKSIKPISYLKAHASELINRVSDNQETMIITQNGEAKVILQDIKIYEEMQKSLALLKILAISSKSLSEGNVTPLEEAFFEIEEKIKESQK